MPKETQSENPVDRRSEFRKNLEQMQNVELKLPGLPIYLFKVKDTSQNGICFLVKEDSGILKHIEVGQILTLRCYSEEKTEPSENFISEIKHITKVDKNLYRGHFLVGLKVLEKLKQIMS